MLLLSSLPLFIGAASALTSAQWRSQSIYQVITDRFALANGSTTQPCGWGNYCGGTWQGITNGLDYIQGMGFTAIWISPIVKNLADSIYGNPYHGYWATDIYSLNPNFGTADDLKALSAALHARGMYLMVDVVANHMASNSAPSAVNYTGFVPFNDQKYYHPYCPIDYSNDTSVQDCWMGDTEVPLPDLRTEDSVVQQTFQAWISYVVQQFSIDGLRLDSAAQTGETFWPGFISSAGVYAVGEVLDGNPNTLCAWQGYMPGMLNYAAYYWILNAFSTTTAPMTTLANNIQWLSATCQDTTLLGNFLENHDQARFPSITNDTGLTKNAIAFTVFNDGIPIIYYGQEQGFAGAVNPYNREPLWPSLYTTKASLYTFISLLNAARKLAISKDPTYASSKSTVWYSDSQTLVTGKGASGSSLISVFTNRGAGSSGTITLNAANTGIKASTRFTDLLNCDVFTADASGNLAITISSGLPRALYPSSALTGSDLCAYTNTGSPSVVSVLRIMSPAASGSTATSSSRTSSSSTTRSSSTTSSSSTAKSSTLSSSTTKSSTLSSSTTKSSTSSSTTKASSSPSSTTTKASTTTSSSKSTTKPSTSLPTTFTTTSACAIASTVAVSFYVNVTTQWLESISVVGSIPELGNWAPAAARNLSATTYTATNTIWNGTVNIAAGTSFQYKFIKYNSTSNALTWEADPNRNYTVARSCATGVVVSGKWQS